MTNIQEVHDAFLARILDDEWVDWQIEEAREDWRQILLAAIPWFKFPRVDLTIVQLEDSVENKEYFVGDLNSTEISILANYMKCEWLNRCIMTWENIKPLYEERDFSEANLLDKLNKTLVYERNNALKQESIYYRSINGTPFDYSKLASQV